MTAQRSTRKRKAPNKKDNATRWPLRSWTALTVAGLLIVHFVLALSSVVHKSNTYDELAHLTRGYSYTLTGDFRLGPPHPPLAHYWAALPGRTMNVKAPKRDQAAWRTSDVWTIGRQFFYYKNLGNAQIIDRLLFRGRAMIALLSVGCGLLVFFWARKLFGVPGAVLSLALFAFSPTMLAHARLVTTDCAVTVFFLAGLTVVWWVLHTVSVSSVLLGAALLSCLFLSKMSAAIIIPVGLILLVLRLIDATPLTVMWRKKRYDVVSRPRRLGIWLAVMLFWILTAWAGIWSAYGFRYQAMTGSDAGAARFYSPNGVPKGKTVWQHQLRGLDHLAPIITFLRDHRVFPEAYVYSAAFSAQTARGRNAFLNGDMSILGFRHFFPYTFLVKTPLSLFGLMGLAGVGILTGRIRGLSDSGSESDTSFNWRRLAWSSAPLWIFWLVYWAASIRSHLNIGHRHILPTYPMVFILCGAAAVFLRSPKPMLRWLTVGLAGLFALASLASFPNYLAYFNVLAGGPDGAYRHLVDSSLDWGQDLPGFKTWLDSHRAENADQSVYLAYFGSGGNLAVSHYGINCPTLPMRVNEKDARGDFRYQAGVYAISATVLQQVYFEFRDPKTQKRQTGHVWTGQMESEYHRLRSRFDLFIAAPDTSAARQPFAKKAFAREFYRFEKLRLARLCAYLRQREPDQNVNHTILIYELDKAAIDSALEGPPPFGDEDAGDP